MNCPEEIAFKMNQMKEKNEHKLLKEFNKMAERGVTEYCNNSTKGLYSVCREVMSEGERLVDEMANKMTRIRRNLEIQYANDKFEFREGTAMRQHRISKERLDKCVNSIVAEKKVDAETSRKLTKKVKEIKLQLKNNLFAHIDALNKFRAEENEKESSALHDQYQMNCVTEHIKHMEEIQTMAIALTQQHRIGKQKSNQHSVEVEVEQEVVKVL